MAERSAEIVLLPVPIFLLELHSERMVDAMMALNQAGFRITHVRGTENRFRIDDEQELKP